MALDGDGLGPAVEAFRAALAEVRGEAWRPLGQALFDRLVAPLDLPAGARLTIVPHGPLHYLPFAALGTGDGLLLERHSYRLLPSATVLAHLAPAGRPTRRELLVLANPDLGQPELDLPGTEAEARAIASVWPGASVLTRKEARKAVLADAGGLYRMLHLASHGTFDPTDPLASRLLLAPAADAAKRADGALTAAEVFAIDLNAELVVLSACETGLGGLRAGDDVVGLVRAFLHAGARSVVASLWPVEDEATAALMSAFYAGLRASKTKTQALQEAQRTLQRRSPHPYFWAAFQVIGVAD